MKVLVTSMSETVSDTEYDVYIVSVYLDECNEGNIHISKRWDFDELLNEAALFINHGGQNSIVQGLQYGVPQCHH
jgi:UDP:flavonoid glycosyltransferase YjiC (YdhE family)